MGPNTVAASERHELCDLLDQLGPDAPTLCAGWTTRDLAAHLVLREGRPDAAGGILLPPLARRTAQVQRRIALQPWPDLVQRVRHGPPWWSPYSLPMLGAKINTMEFFVHHEDVRRARTGWEPRTADPRRAGMLWTLLGLAARVLYRNSPVGVVLRTPDGSQRSARRGVRSVIVVGCSEELMLHAYGRAETMVDVEGDPVDVQRLQDSPRGF